jgi:RNA polymerase sigma-70 factor, ECF subfamily
MAVDIGAFVATLGSASASDLTALAAALERALQVAQGAWPNLAVPPGMLVERLAECVRGEGPDFVTALDNVAAADVYHCCGCLLELPAALEQLERAHLASVPAFIAHLERPPDFADEVCQVVRQKLLVPEGSSPPRLTAYLGHGPLHSWIAVVTQRAALDLLRKQNRMPAMTDSALERYLSNSADPDLMLVKARLRTLFEEALRASLARLTIREQAALRLTLVAGFTLERVGIMYGVNASTVSRWLARARETLLAEIQSFLKERRNLDPAELESMVRLVRSQVDVSLSSFLGGDPLPPMG